MRRDRLGHSSYLVGDVANVTHDRLKGAPMFFGRLFCAMSSLILSGLAAAGPAHADPILITFENLASPPAINASSASFSAANGGSDTVDGVRFDDNFLVFGRAYSAVLGGSDPYGVPNGSYAITNGDGSGGTGAFAPGLDGLTITTHLVLTSAYFAANDYGNGSFGADQVTVTALGRSFDLAAVSLDLADAQGNPIRTLTKMAPAASWPTAARSRATASIAT